MIPIKFRTIDNSHSPLAVLLLYLFITYWLLKILYALCFHSLSKYPGPFLARISRTWLFIQILGGNAEKTQRTFHQKYGPISRTAPNEVAIANPESVKTIYAVKSGFTKTDFYTPFKPNFRICHDHFTNLDEKVHAERRKIANDLYSISNILRSEEYIDICSEV